MGNIEAQIRQLEAIATLKKVSEETGARTKDTQSRIAKETFHNIGGTLPQAPEVIRFENEQIVHFRIKPQ